MTNQNDTPSSPDGFGAYMPIACGLHDRLEALATMGRPCLVVYRADDGRPHEVRERIMDVFARGGEEFVRLGSTLEIRLDRLVRVDGVRFDAGSPEDGS